MSIELSTDALFESRFEICKGCEQYNGQAFEGGGQCMACGCPLQKKLRIKMDACPLGKWGPDVSAASPQSISSGDLQASALPATAPVPQPVPANTPPSISDMAKSFFSSAAKFVSAGLPRTPLEQLQVRLDTCKACEYWNSGGFGGTGSCNQCGCSTQVKLRMATAECPMGYWQAVPALAEG